MNNAEELIKKHISDIKIGEKDVSQLISFLKENGKFIEMPFNEINEVIFATMICKAEGAKDVVPYVLELESYIKSDKYSFLCYKFPKTAENDEFYKNYNKYNEDYIYVVFEEKSKQTFSNCMKLHLELDIEKGISQADFDNKSSRFYSYLSSLEFLKQKMY